MLRVVAGDKGTDNVTRADSVILSAVIWVKNQCPM